MPLARTRDYLSIGEVLDTLRPEFPDVSISKIRFLESEGLIAPQRTKSGYRKFYDGDVDRLRYVLTLQRDHFMPLKVIKDRLAGGQPLPVNGGGAAPPKPSKASAAEKAAPQDLTEVQLDKGGLLKASGLSAAELSGLTDFGLLEDRKTYDGADLLVAKAARGFLDLGIEPRHLRMYRQFADREAAFFEQITTPVARRKTGPTNEAHATAQKLVALSRKMWEGLSRQTVGDDT